VRTRLYGKYHLTAVHLHATRMT